MPRNSRKSNNSRNSRRRSRNSRRSRRSRNGGGSSKKRVRRRRSAKKERGDLVVMCKPRISTPKKKEASKLTRTELEKAAKRYGIPFGDKSRGELIKYLRKYAADAFT